MRCLLTFLLFFPWLLMAETQKTYRWPTKYEGRQQLDVSRLEPGKNGAVGFETEGFRFYSDSKIANADWRSIMIVCEGLRGALKSLPLDVIKPTEAKPPGKETVRIFEQEAAYHQAGGLESTVGTYLPRSGDVLIWMEGLNEPDPDHGKFSLSKARQYDLLVHELTHQATGREFRRLPVWFSEGLAEYLAAAHNSPGIYSFKDPSGAIKSHVKKYLGAVANKDRFGIVPLRTLVALDGRAWAENTRTGTGHGPFLKYVSAVLLLHYFCHLDPDRNHGEIVRNFLAALRAGKPASRATVETSAAQDFRRISKDVSLMRRCLA